MKNLFNNKYLIKRNYYLKMNFNVIPENPKYKLIFLGDQGRKIFHIKSIFERYIH